VQQAMRGKLARRGIILGGERCAELRAEGTGEHAYCTAEGSDMPQPQALVRPAQLPAVPAPTSSSEPEESRAADHEAPARHEDGQARGEALPESDHLQIPTPLENESDLPGGYLSDSSRESAARLLRPPPQAETQGTSPPGLLPSLVGQGGSPPLLVERGGSPPEGPSELASSGDGRSLLRPEALEALERHRKDTEGHPRGTLEKGNISERPDTLEGFSELREALETLEASAGDAAVLHQRHVDFADFGAEGGGAEEAASAGHTLAENTSLHRQMGRRTDRRIERCATSYAIQAAAPCIQTATLCVQAATLCVQAVAC
jgi:hypothetical protein